MTLGLFCLGVTTVSAQVAGRVVNASTETPLSGATVQVWDSYPGGSVLLSGTTNGSGAFALGDPGVGSFDVRVYRSGYYPTVVR
ncbi:MAG TPA: carboxypeptidase regulatory-like domain-containing protein, partial [candidate division Zixibacteria bacterium]